MKSSVKKEGGQQDSKKRKRANPSEKASLLVDTISANRMKAEEHMDLYKTMDVDAISRCHVDPDSQRW